MFQKILVPVGGTELGEAALARARALATLSGGQIVILRVVPPPATTRMADPVVGVGVPVAGVDPAKLVEAEKEVADEYLRALRGRLPRDVPFGLRERYGDPAEEIVAAAREEGADLIAMSTHGRAGLERFFFGSVADAVVRHAEVPLLLVPPHAAAEEPAKEEPAKEAKANETSP